MGEVARLPGDGRLGLMVMRGLLTIFLPIAIAVAVVGTAMLTLPACAVGVFAWADACPPTPDYDSAARLAALEARRAALEAEIAGLQRRVAAVPVCQRIAGAPPPPAAVEPRPRPDRSPPPDIDRERWEDQDLALLEGCWQLVSPVAYDPNDAGEQWELRSQRLCFDDTGRGTVRQDWHDRRVGPIVCEGPVRAAFEGSALRISHDGYNCRPTRHVIREGWRLCRLQPNGQARCAADSRQRSDATLVRE